MILVKNSKTRKFVLSFVFTSYLFIFPFGAATKHDVSVAVSQNHGTESDAIRYLDQLEKIYSTACNKRTVARWAYKTNITQSNTKSFVEAETEYLNFQSRIQEEILTLFPNWREFKNESIKRELEKISTRGPGAMSPDSLTAMTKLQKEMEVGFATAVVCAYKDPTNCTMRLEPDIEHILLTSTDPDELAYYWTAWHDKMSEVVPPSKFKRYLAYQLEMAKAKGFNDMSEQWVMAYHDGSPNWTVANFKQEILDIWEDMRPQYETIHAYVRMKLRRLPEYKNVIEKCGYIPAHLTGNMWSQTWDKFEVMFKPYPNAPSVDATKAMLKNNCTVLSIFEEADKFFTGLGLEPMTETFWKNSMLERPEDGREVICHASADDFCLGENSTDFRIKQCTRVNIEYLIITHHEMGHIQYFQQYRHLHYAFREGANPGFHEAIGDALTLAVVTPKHLQCSVGLDMNLDPSICTSKSRSAQVSENDINFLYLGALIKLANFPWTLLVDIWRWEAFEGKLAPEQYNKRWWELKMKYQGISPPTNRSFPHLFDPAAKYHIVSNNEYLRYFISRILLFQFHEAMCIAAGEYDPNNPTSAPLHQCDFSGSKKAGKVLGDMLKLGSSKGWPIALEKITGSKKMSTSSIKNYFKPLISYIRKELEDNGEVIGFGNSCEEVARNREKKIVG